MSLDAAAGGHDDVVRGEVRDVFLLTLRRLRERLASKEPLTGAELQAALRFCSDNDLTVRNPELLKPADSSSAVVSLPFAVRESLTMANATPPAAAPVLDLARVTALPFAKRLPPHA